MTRVVYYGYLAKGFFPLICKLKNYFDSCDIEFYVIFTAINKEENLKYIKDNLEFINLNYLVLEPYESFIDFFPADFYLLWGGYDGVLGQYRNLLKKTNKPHLLIEYTGIKDLFHFDTALNGESDFLNKRIHKFKNIDFDKLESLLKLKTNNQEEISNQLINITSGYEKVISYFAIWDWAAGINSSNDEATIKKISEFFHSSYEALRALFTNIDENTLLIVKPHPHDTAENKLKFKNLSLQHKNIVYVENDFTVSEIIQISDCIVTIASTIYIDSIFYKKPLVLLGSTYASVSNYPYKLSDYNSISDCLESALKLNNWSQKIKDRELFFIHFFKNANVYSIDKMMHDCGVKDIESIGDLIKNRFKENRNMLKSELNYYLPFLNHIIKKYNDNIWELNFILEKISLYEYTISEKLEEIEKLNKILDNNKLELSDKEENINRLQKKLEDNNIELVNKNKKLELLENKLSCQDQSLKFVEEKLKENQIELANIFNNMNIIKNELKIFKQSKLVLNGKVIL